MDSKLKETLRWVLKNPRSSTVHMKHSLNEEHSESRASRNQSSSEDIRSSSILNDQSQNNKVLERIYMGDKRVRSTLLEKFTSCFCIQTEPSGSSSESTADDSAYRFHPSSRARSKSLKAIDRGDEYLLEMNAERVRLLTTKNIQLYSNETDGSFACCRTEKPDISACSKQNVAYHNNVGKELSKSEEFVKAMCSSNRVVSLQDVDKGDTGNSDQTIYQTSFHEYGLGGGNQQTRAILKVANEVFCASKILSNAIDTLRRHIPQALDNANKPYATASDSLLSHGSVSNRNNYKQPPRHSSFHNGVHEQTVITMLHDVSQFNVLTCEPDVACNLVPKIVSDGRDGFQRAKQNVLISIQDMDPIEPVQRKQSPFVGAEFEKQAQITAVQTHLSLGDPDLSRLQIKARFPSPNVQPNNSIHITAALGSDNNYINGGQAKVPATGISKFQPNSPEETSVTEADEVLSADETESIRSLPDLDEMLDRPFIADLVSKLADCNDWKGRSTRESDHVQSTNVSSSATRRPTIRSMRHMMAGDSHLTQCSRMLSTTTPGGDFRSVPDGGINLNARTNAEHVTRDTFRQLHSQFDNHVKALRGTCRQTILQHDLEKLSYDEIPTQRNNHNQKLTELVASDDTIPQREEEHFTNTPKPSSSADSALRFVNETSLEVSQTCFVQTTSGEQANVTIGAALDDLVAANQISTVEQRAAPVLGQDTVLDQSTQTAPSGSTYDIVTRQVEGTGLDSPREQRRTPTHHGEGDDPRHGQRHPTSSASRRALRSRRRATRRHPLENQSRNTAPASIFTEQHPPLRENLMSIVDDAYDSILEQIQTLFATNDEIGWTDRWRPLVRVPGPHSGDVAVQVDTEIGVNVRTTTARRTHSTLEI